MPHVVEAGTDAALVILFDPAAHPDDFDTRYQDDPDGVLKELEVEGRVVSIYTGADGGYLLHSFVDEEIPTSLQSYLSDPKETPDFQVPSGRLYFIGGEYGARDADKSLAEHAHMGGPFSCTPGQYELTLWRAEYPDDIQETQFASEVSPAVFAVHQSIGWLLMVAVVGGITFGIAALAIEWNWWLTMFLAIEALLICLPFVVMLLPIYRRADQRWQDIGRQYPSIVAHLVSKA